MWRKIGTLAAGATVGGLFGFFAGRGATQAPLEIPNSREISRDAPAESLAVMKPSAAEGLAADTGDMLVPDKDSAEHPVIPYDPSIFKFGFPGPINDVQNKTSYSCSYNRALRNPNWAAEHLTAESVKERNADRRHSHFSEDERIPPEFRALLADYRRSGFDRGHLVPAADARHSQESMNDTFKLTNICPQVGAGFNRDYWMRLEVFVRNLTKTFDDVYCITGPLYLPARDAETGKWFVKYQVIGDPPNVAVPTHFYKVLLGTNKKRPNEAAVAAFVLPNAKINDHTPLKKFAYDVSAVEKAAGLKFFESVFQKGQQSAVNLCQRAECDLPIVNHDKRK